MRESCQSCRFFHSPDAPALPVASSAAGGGTEGICRRYPPVTVSDRGVMFSALPGVAGGHWCGEYDQGADDAADAARHAAPGEPGQEPRYRRRGDQRPD